MTPAVESALAAGNLAEAEKFARAALAAQPHEPENWLTLGEIARQSGRADIAALVERRALALWPADPSLLNNLGLSLGHGSVSLRWLSRALRAAPDWPGIRLNFADRIHGAGQVGAAVRLYTETLALDPAFGPALNNLGHGLRDRAEGGRSLIWYRRAGRLDPANLFIASNLMMSAMEQDAPDYPALARAFGARQALPVRPLRRAGHKLRIGYVSPDFRRHSLAFFLRPLLANHDRDRVTVTAYAELAAPDAVSAELQGLVDHWVPTVGVSDAALAQRIAADGIDVLVDLAGHTQGNRLGVFARRPAAVQVSWLGYNATVGLDAIDYRLADRWVAPEDGPEAFVEQLWRLPDRPCHCFRPDDAAPAVMPGPAARGAGPVFGSFNHLNKLDDRTLALWARTLSAVPKAQLRLKAHQAGDQSVQRAIRARFARHGIDPARIGFLPWQPAIGDHLAAYGEIDVMLDPLGYNGTTTSCEGLWQGVPLITRPGERFLSRVGLSLLAALGLPELVAETDDDFVGIVAGLASDSARLAALRAGLRPRMAASALCDEAGFARAVEGAFSAMVAAL